MRASLGLSDSDRNKKIVTRDMLVSQNRRGTWRLRDKDRRNKKIVTRDIEGS